MILAAAPAAIYAFSAGPPIMRTGAAVDGGQDCTACHRTFAPANTGVGKVSIKAVAYTPGVKQQITVMIEDPDAARWGFQITARPRNDETKMAGTFAPSDFVRVRCAPAGADGPCDGALEFAEHTLAGTRPGSPSPGVFTLDWTPPAQDVGDIIFYAAGNAANNNNNNNGDHIYTTNLVISPASAQTKPSISATRGVLNAASLDAVIAPNTWVSIFGTYLSSTIRTWKNSEIASGTLPSQLDGVSVTISGKAAPIYFVSPEQINVLAPATLTEGNAQVQVSVNGVTTNTATAQVKPVAPALFVYDGKYVVAVHADGSLVGKDAPAKPGETITVFATGLGATNPAIPDGRVIESPLPLSGSVIARFGSASADVSSARLTSAGVYQVSVKTPDSMADGDALVTIEMAGVKSQDNAIIPVRR